MGLLFSKLWSLFGNEEHKIVIVGLDNAGKTTILYQFLMNEVVHTSPTIGSNVEEVVWRNIHFIMWDLGGQQSLRAAWSTYYTNTEFVIVVIDSTDKERLMVIREELYKMLSNEELSKAGVLIYANKQDLKGSMSASEISRQLDLTSIKQQQWHIQSCCALTGEGAKKMMVALLWDSDGVILTHCIPKGTTDASYQDVLKNHLLTAVLKKRPEKAERVLFHCISDFPMVKPDS